MIPLAFHPDTFPVQDHVLKFLPWSFVYGLKVTTRLVHEGESHGQTLDEIAAAGGLSLEETYLHAKRCGRYPEREFPHSPTDEQMRATLRRLAA